MGGHELLDALVEFGDMAERGQQCHQPASPHGLPFQHCRIQGGWRGLVDGGDALLDAFLGATVLLVKELAKYRLVLPGAFTWKKTEPAAPSAQKHVSAGG